jgi:hypothetical protein
MPGKSFDRVEISKNIEGNQNSMSRFNIAVRNVVAPPWLNARRIQVGQVSQSQGTPELFVLIEKAGAPYLRVDLYADSEQPRCFQEAIVWLSWIVIGFGSSVHFISLSDGATKTVELDDYFGHLYPEEDFLLIATGSSLIRFDHEAGIVWGNHNLGLDGVLVQDISDGLVSGEGEWDPPGGWKPFQVSLETGEKI